MRPLIISVGILWFTLGRAAAQPVADHHQHLFGPGVISRITAGGNNPDRPITSVELIRQLNEAGIRRAVVLSTAYILASPTRDTENERQQVIAENDWTAAQVAVYPDRLVGFCSANPLKSYAVEEIARCATIPQLRKGVKLHFGHARVDYHNAEHVAQLRRVFRAANDHQMAIVVHLRPSDEQISYGREEALIFLHEILPAAPNVPVQIAHLAGETGNPEAVGDRALSAFADVIERGDPLASRLWFDVTQVARANTSPERAVVITRRIRQLGLQRVLYGSDAPLPNLTPRDNWAAFRRLPLSAEEIDIIARNVAPYLR